MSITHRHIRELKLASTCSCRLAIPAPRSSKVPFLKRLNFSRRLKRIRAAASDWQPSTLSLNNLAVSFTSNPSNQPETDFNLTFRYDEPRPEPTSLRQLFK